MKEVCLESSAKLEEMLIMDFCESYYGKISRMLPEDLKINKRVGFIWACL